ncbi:MAG TPA: FecR domain-containing protein [Planctomycetota bacterium]|nr:FecR domain-containing protein [Planctomycetota bacterium]
MTESDYSALLMQLLDGTISEVDAEKLQAAFARDPDRLTEAAEQFRIHHMLQGLKATEDFAARIQSSLRASSASESHVRRLESAVMRGVAHAGRRPKRRLRLPGESSFNFYAAAAMFGLILIGGVLLYSLSSPDIPGPEVASVTGIAHTEADRDLRPGAILAEGALVRVQNGSITLKYPDGTLITLDRGTAARFSQASGAKAIELQSGSLNASVARQAQNRPLIVSTANASAIVVGTRLRLAFANSATELHVYEGTVKFQRKSDASSVLVNSGFWSVAAADSEMVAFPQTPIMPLTFELEDFGNAGRSSQANGPTRQIYRERPPLGDVPHGGWAIAVPGIGTTVSGKVPLPSGTYRLWVRWRDENRGVVSFEVFVGEKLVGSVKGSGKSTEWKWSEFEFESKGGAAAITLRSTTEGSAIPEDKLKSGTDLFGPQHPYDVVNRWDQLQITSDMQYRPDK